MKTPVLIAASTLLLFSPAPAQAMPSTLRTAEGRIVSVQPASRQFTFERADNGKRFVLTWNRRTLFGHGSAAGSAAPFRAGQRARVSYRLPLFGPDYSSRVIVLPAASAAAHQFSWSSKSKSK
jgi:hypothetical protein